MPAATVPFLSDFLAPAGAFVAGVRIERAPLAVRARLRVQMASVLAAAMAGDLASAAAPIMAWARRGSGAHPLVGTGRTTARMEALVGSIARARAGEWDDFALLGRPGAAAVMVPIVLGAPSDVAWSEIEAAQLAAVEIGARAGVATALATTLGDDPHAVAALGAAAAAARVLGLSAEASTAALSRAVGLAGGYEEAALGGVLAAELAYEGERGARRAPANFASEPFASLGHAWFAETIHPREHPGPACVQTAIDAAREIAAQGRAIKGRALRADDVAHVALETTVLGAAPDVRATLERAVSRAMRVETKIHVAHAWELTSELLWRALSAIEPKPLLGRVDLRRALAALDIGAASITHLAAEISRLLSRLRPIDPAIAVRALALPLATRIVVRLVDGTPLRAERVTPRGAPDAPLAEAHELVREKLRIAAGPRGRRIADRVLAPPPAQRVSDVLAAMGTGTTTAPARKERSVAR